MTFLVINFRQKARSYKTFLPSQLFKKNIFFLLISNFTFQISLLKNKNNDEYK